MKFFGKNNFVSSYSSSGTININGNSYNGNNVTIVGNKVFVDGKDQTPDAKDIRIEIGSNIDKLEVDYANSISISGDVNSVRSSSGDVSIKGSVNGSVITSSGDVVCGKVSGDVVTSSGDINKK